MSPFVHDLVRDLLPPSHVALKKGYILGLAKWESRKSSENVCFHCWLTPWSLETVNPNGGGFPLMPCVQMLIQNFSAEIRMFKSH